MSGDVQKLMGPNEKGGTPISWLGYLVIQRQLLILWILMAGSTPVISCVWKMKVFDIWLIAVRIF